MKDRFTQEGRRWYFPDGARAFRDHGRRLSTRSENTEVIASLLEIAKARGWESITVRGSERFRQEAWSQAKLAGFEVRGYRASDAERGALARALARRGYERASEALPLDPAPGKDEPAKRSAGEGKARTPTTRDEPITGRLLDHGADRYEFNSKADPSYFVRLDTPQGKRVIWGLDLERAMKEALSQPKLGDAVVLQHRGSKPVTVVRRELDAQGHVLNETQVSSRRNTWSIETEAFIEQRARAAKALRDTALSPARVAEKHPELAGTLLQVHAAKLAARGFSDPRDRERFVSTVRGALADEVARGEPLRAVHVKEGRDRRAPRQKEDATPAR